MESTPTQPIRGILRRPDDWRGVRDFYASLDVLKEEEPMHLSASSLILYTDCSLRWKFRYIDKIDKFKPSIHLAYGSAIHKALEELNKSLIDSKLDIEDVLQYFHDSYIEETEKMGLDGDFFFDKLYYMGINSVIDYYENYVDYEVIGTETKFDVPIIYPDGTEEKDCTLYGFVDAIIKRKNNLMIIDYKTSREPYNKFKIDTSIQLSLYSYAFRHLLREGKFPNIKKKKEDYIAYYVLMKDYDNLESNIKLQQKKIGDEQLARLSYIIKKTLQGKEQEMYLPNYNSQCNWCDFKKECLEFTGDYTFQATDPKATRAKSKT